MVSRENPSVARPPQMSRESTSRPNWSVPRRWANEYPANLFLTSMVVGSHGAARGAHKASTATANKKTDGAHSLMLNRGEPQNIDSCFAEEAENMEPGDICIAGANLVDIDGRAAIMAGSPLGGAPLRVLASLQTEGVRTIIAAGLEKYAPCCLDDSLSAASRKGIRLAMGMASGLVSIAGQVINEVDASYILGAEDVCVIGRGGIAGCEGGTTLSVTVKDEIAEEFFEMVREANRLGARAVSGEKESLSSCLATHCGPTGAGHKSCCYRAERLKNRSGE